MDICLKNQRAQKDLYSIIYKYFSEGLGIDGAKQKALRDLYFGRK